MNKTKQLVLFLFTLSLLVGCSGDDPVEEDSKIILVKTIVINGSDIDDGKAKQLDVVVLPSNAENREVTWSVSDEQIAVISTTGLLTPIANGSVIVTAKAKDKSEISTEKTIKISGVTAPPVFVESITINAVDITDGNSQELSVNVLPANANNKAVIWSVSDASIAEISNEGLLTPKMNGLVTVMATATDGSDKKGEIAINISGVSEVYATDLRAENMLLWQRNNGGWAKEPYNDFSGYDREQTSSEIATAENDKSKTDTTIDNNHTVGELEYLLKAYKSTNNPNYLEAAQKGIDYLFTAQYDNGGWPQYYPDKSGYRARITFNDNAMANVMNLMWDISKGLNNTDVVDASYKDKAATAFNKGIEVILKTQIIVGGKKTAWCAQHDEVTLIPAKARSYELASISGSESVGVVKVLMLVEQPSSEIIDAVTSAMDWFESVKIKDIATEKITDSSQPSGKDVVVVSSPGNIIWARFYDLDTNLPFFCGRDGIKKNTLAEIDNDRRTGYAWYGNWPSKINGSTYTNWKSKNGL